ncbi:LacI family DNA-binding transcriptional regulator [Patiriisocius marinus]|uniref:LacI family transcriptional regulator n=1 Tax=Patiriisocius marinus TaxID=1397112 RepID=A0A5J4J0Q8_9FLAO|nr:LacI family DNA-binding transcriptional regulator [Patiriisocius marinus]GER59548.1 LacI family transcriptional regulator [Patiriisocius marinus]
MKPTTLKEIAKKLGLSIPTVSKALKDYPDVSAKTKKLVLNAAEELKYRPNSFAVNLRTKESKTIGLIVPEIVHYFFSNAIKGIVNQAEKKGYLVIILQSNESFELEKKQIELLLNKNVDGVLISLANSTADYSHLSKILEYDIPLVMFDKIAKLVNCSKVIIDDRKAAYKATQHLIDIGCKKIAHFRGPLLPQNSIDRFLGYKKALEDNNIIYDSSLVFTCDEMTFDQGKNFAKKICKEQIDLDAIFISSDLVAIGAVTEFKIQGVLIPEQISIVGFSNWFMSSAITPSLSTIDQPGYEMGKIAFKRLYKELNLKKENKEITPKIIELETELVVRDSTK